MDNITIKVERTSTHIGTVSYPQKFGNKKFPLTNEKTIYNFNKVSVENNIPYVIIESYGIPTKINYNKWIESNTYPLLAKFIL